jgi:hypothetical protein
MYVVHANYGLLIIGSAKAVCLPMPVGKFQSVGVLVVGVTNIFSEGWWVHTSRQ